MEVIGETEKAYSDSKFMSSKNWFSFFLCGFSIVYVAFSMGFLNVLYAEKLLFSWQGPGKSLYFSQDIFDVFWLIIAAIPNGAFSAWLFGEISAKGLQEKKKRNLFWLFTGLINVSIRNTSTNVECKPLLIVTRASFTTSVRKFVNIPVIGFTFRNSWQGG